jgi:hypothetical protein
MRAHSPAQQKTHAQPCEGYAQAEIVTVALAANGIAGLDWANVLALLHADWFATAIMMLVLAITARLDAFTIPTDVAMPTITTFFYVPMATMCRCGLRGHWNKQQRHERACN